jgi:hypothetical protein
LLAGFSEGLPERRRETLQGNIACRVNHHPTLIPPLPNSALSSGRIDQDQHFLPVTMPLTA